jgi:hypothetical protein
MSSATAPRRPFRLTVMLTPDERTVLFDRARGDGKTVAQVVRDALDLPIATPRGTAARTT